MLNYFNEFVQDIGYSDEMIYVMDELDYLLEGMTPTEIIKSVDADFNIYGEYFTHSGMHWVSLFSDWDLVEHVKDIGLCDEFVEWLLNNDFIKIDVDEYGTWLYTDEFPIRERSIADEALTHDEVVDYLVDNLYRLIYL